MQAKHKTMGHGFFRSEKDDASASTSLAYQMQVPTLPDDEPENPTKIKKLIILDALSSDQKAFYTAIAFVFL